MAKTAAERMAAMRARRREATSCLDCGVSIRRYARCAFCREQQADLLHERRVVAAAVVYAEREARGEVQRRTILASEDWGPALNRGLALPAERPGIDYDGRVQLNGGYWVLILSTSV